MSRTSSHHELASDSTASSAPEPLKKHLTWKDILLIVVIVALLVWLGYVAITFDTVSAPEYLAAQQRYNVTRSADVVAQTQYESVDPLLGYVPSQLASRFLTELSPEVSFAQ